MDKRFDWWCKTAVDQIHYWPDRDAVYQELMDHLQDRYDAATDRGLSPEEAAEEALQSMGSAAELAPVLGAVHRPYDPAGSDPETMMLYALAVTSDYNMGTNQNTFPFTVRLYDKQDTLLCEETVTLQSAAMQAHEKQSEVTP